MQHGWWNQQLPDLVVATNIAPASSSKPLGEGGAISYLAGLYTLIRHTPQFLVARYDSETALRRRNPATNRTVYTTALPDIEYAQILEDKAGTLKPHFDVSIRSTPEDS